MPLAFRRDVSLRPFNTFGLDAVARTYVEVDRDDAWHELVARPEWRDRPRLVLGGGSNVVLTRDFDGLVVRIATRGLRRLDEDADHRWVEAAAGESWDAVVRRTIAAGWPGLENLAWIPGTVGAAPVQNVGAYGVELVDRFGWLDAVDVDTGEAVRMDADACRFGYRDSVFKRELRDRLVIVRVVFRLPVRWVPVTSYGDVAARLASPGSSPRSSTHSPMQTSTDPTPAEVADVVTAIRREKLPDPTVVGNAGSFFKNPVVDRSTFERLRAGTAGDAAAPVGYPQPDGSVKLAAAWLVERCGWKGRGLAGPASRAAVHDRQALVLVNRGGATGRDIVALADAIAADVATHFGIRLEPEPLIV